MVGVDSEGPSQSVPHLAHGGLEPAVAIRGDESAGQALSRMRQAGASLVVTLDADGRPQTVVPEKTLTAAQAGQQAATCQPAWPAATFIQPASASEARRLAAHNQNQPFLGHRTVVVETGRIAGVVPLPALIDRPGPTS
jgi:signal-transduction protein with cAMP-binding, CBS, and nucleotidyltransferase domain